jgi:hypothetical protein
LPDRAGSEAVTLYRLLAVAAPSNAPPGETLTTRQKETIDNDVEAFGLEVGMGDDV